MAMDFWAGKPPKNSAIARNYQELSKGSKKGAKHDDKAGAIAAEFPKPDKNAVPLDPH